MSYHQQNDLTVMNLMMVTFILSYLLPTQDGGRFGKYRTKHSPKLSEIVDALVFFLNFLSVANGNSEISAVLK